MMAGYVRTTNLKLNLGLSNVLLATAATGNLLSLRDLVLDGLRAEVLKGVTLNGVDAQLRAGLDSGETARNCGQIQSALCPPGIHICVS